MNFLSSIMDEARKLAGQFKGKVVQPVQQAIKDYHPLQLADFKVPQAPTFSLAGTLQSFKPLYQKTQTEVPKFFTQSYQDWQAKPANQLGAKIVAVSPLGQVLPGFVKGMSYGYAPEQTYENIPQPKSTWEKIAFGGGELVGFGLSPITKAVGAIAAPVKLSKYLKMPLEFGAYGALQNQPMEQRPASFAIGAGIGAVAAPLTTLGAKMLEKIKFKPPVISEQPSFDLPVKLNPSRGLGQDLIRSGYTKDEVKKLSVEQAQTILFDAKTPLEQEMASIARETPVTRKINLVDYIRTPENVLKKIGLGNEADYLRTQHEGYQTQLPKELDKITSWMKQAPGQESNVKIFNWLDGNKVQLTVNEMKVASEIKTYLADWADKLGLPPTKRISDYITHLYEKGIIQREFDEDLAKIIDPKMAKEVYDPFLQKRVSGRIDYLKDTWRALQAYTKRATRKFYMDPALEGLAKREPDLELSQWNYVKRLTDRVNMRPVELDNIIDTTIKSIPGVGYRLGQRPTATLSKTGRQLVYRGTLGLNFSSALRNITQGANSYAELGEKYTFIGYKKALQNWTSGELERVGVLQDSFVQDQTPTVFKSVLGKIDKVLFSLFEAAEKLNRGACYYGGLTKAEAAGKTGQEAINYAKNLVRKTQFTFGSIDTPVAMSSDLMKVITQLQSYNIKQIEFLAGKVKAKEWGGLLRFIGSTLVLQKLFRDALGIKLDITPMNISIPPIPKMALAIKDVVSGVPTGKADVLKNLPAFIPAGSQGRKTIQGAQLLNQGYSLTPTGKARFAAPQDTLGKARALAFGPYGTEAGQEYAEGGFRATSVSTNLSRRMTAALIAGDKQKLSGLVSEARQIGVTPKDTARTMLTEVMKIQDKTERQTAYNKILPFIKATGLTPKEAETTLKSAQFPEAKKDDLIKQFAKAKTPAERQAILLKIKASGMKPGTFLKKVKEYQYLNP